MSEIIPGPSAIRMCIEETILSAESGYTYMERRGPRFVDGGCDDFGVFTPPGITTLKVILRGSKTDRTTDKVVEFLDRGEFHKGTVLYAYVDHIGLTLLRADGRFILTSCQMHGVAEDHRLWEMEFKSTGQVALVHNPVHLSLRDTFAFAEAEPDPLICLGLRSLFYSLQEKLS